MRSLRCAVVAVMLASLTVPLQPPAHAAAQPNIFFYNLDDLRDQVVGGVDPLSFMPKVRQWMADGPATTTATSPSRAVARRAPR